MQLSEVGWKASQSFSTQTSQKIMQFFITGKLSFTMNQLLEIFKLDWPLNSHPLKVNNPQRQLRFYLGLFRRISIIVCTFRQRNMRKSERFQRSFYRLDTMQGRVIKKLHLLKKAFSCSLLSIQFQLVFVFSHINYLFYHKVSFKRS